MPAKTYIKMKKIIKLAQIINGLDKGQSVETLRKEAEKALIKNNIKCSDAYMHEPEGYVHIGRIALFVKDGAVLLIVSEHYQRKESVSIETLKKALNAITAAENIMDSHSVSGYSLGRLAAAISGNNRAAYEMDKSKNAAIKYHDWYLILSDEGVRFLR